MGFEICNQLPLLPTSNSKQFEIKFEKYLDDPWFDEDCICVYVLPVSALVSHGVYAAEVRHQAATATWDRGPSAGICNRPWSTCHRCSWSKPEARVKMGQDGSRWVKMGQDGSRWVKMGQDGSRWVKMGQDGPSSAAVLLTLCQVWPDWMIALAWWANNKPMSSTVYWLVFERRPGWDQAWSQMGCNMSNVWNCQPVVYSDIPIKSHIPRMKKETSSKPHSPWLYWSGIHHFLGDKSQQKNIHSHHFPSSACCLPCCCASAWPVRGPLPKPPKPLLGTRLIPGLGKIPLFCADYYCVAKYMSHSLLRIITSGERGETERQREKRERERGREGGIYVSVYMYLYIYIYIYIYYIYIYIYTIWYNMYVFSHAKPQHYRNCVLRRTKYVPTKGCPGVQCTPMAMSKRDMSPGVSQPRLVSKARPEVEATAGIKLLDLCKSWRCAYFSVYHIWYIYIYI